MSTNDLDKNRKEAAILIVDPQNDFFPGGSLPVKNGNDIIPVCNGWVEASKNRAVPLLISRDWHPENTAHFVSDGGTWPAHCVQGTFGAEFHPNLIVPHTAFVVSKGTSPEEDGTSYSAFRGSVDKPGDWRNGMKAAELLKKMGVKRIYVMGLATDYCVKESVLDARKEGFEVTVINEGIRAVNINASDEKKAVVEMEKAGAKFV